MGFFQQLFSLDFMPHGFCYLWNPRIVWLHVIADGLIALSYYCISIFLIYFNRQNRDRPFNRVFWMFGAFILACGTTHMMEIWNVWHGSYLLAGVVKAITAAISVVTVVVLLPLIPKVISLPELVHLQEANGELEREIAERKQAEQALKESLATRESAIQELAEQKFALDQHAIVAVTDLQGTITYVNDRFSATTQYSREEAIGQNYRIVNSGYHPKEFFQQMYDTLGKGRVWHGEIRNRAKDGSIFWVDATSVPLLDSEGKPRQYITIRTDITARKRSEEMRERLGAVVESSDDAIISNTLNGIVTAWNSGAERLFGYTSADALGKPMDRLLPLERANEESDILARIARGEHFTHFETLRVRKDGQRVDISATISPVKDSSGAIAGVATIARDITQRKASELERRQAEEDLARKVDELARSNAELEQFAYIASHDLQEPLRMVAAYTQLLGERYRGRLDENADKFIGYACEGALRMQTLVRDLLAFSRIGRSDAACVRVDCGAAMAEVLQSLGPAIGESAAVVTHGALPVVWADRSQVTQVLQNLIGNAIKFRGKEAPAISVQAEKAGEQWLFSVSDNGIGIAPEYRENIFVVFQRLHTRTEYPGNGIGLAICRKIVERGGGKIWVEAQAGHGSTFRFTLPCAGPAENDLRGEKMSMSSLGAVSDSAVTIGLAAPPETGQAPSLQAGEVTAT